VKSQTQRKPHDVESKLVICIEEYDQGLVNALDATLSRFGYQWWGTGFEHGAPARVVFVNRLNEVFKVLDEELLAVL